MTFIVSLSLPKYRNLEGISVEIEEDMLIDLCNSHGEFGEDQYERWFNYKYHRKRSYAEAKQEIRTMFPPEFDCEDIMAKSLVDVVQRGQRFNTHTVLADPVTDWSFKQEDGDEYRVGFEDTYFKPGDKGWQIAYIDLYQNNSE